MLDFDYLKIITDNFKYVNYTIYRMEPSEIYFKLMNKKWKKTKEQINLMIKEDCKNNNFSII